MSLERNGKRGETDSTGGGDRGHRLGKREREREALGIKGGGTRPADSWVTTHHSDGFTFALN